MLCTLQYHLNSVSFFCHYYKLLYQHAVGPGLLQYTSDAILIDCSKGLGWHFQSDPFILLRNVKPFFVQIRVKLSLGFIIGMRNVIPASGALTGYLTYSWHLSVFKMDCKYRKKIPNQKPVINLILPFGILKIESSGSSGWRSRSSFFTDILND